MHAKVPKQFDNLTEFSPLSPSKLEYNNNNNNNNNSNNGIFLNSL
jgi:hypothetical protein